MYPSSVKLTHKLGCIVRARKCLEQCPGVDSMDRYDISLTTRRPFLQLLPTRYRQECGTCGPRPKAPVMAGSPGNITGTPLLKRSTPRLRTSRSVFMNGEWLALKRRQRHAK